MQQSAPAELKAILWDVDGTLAETERDGHRVAFNRAFESLELPWRWSEARYGELLAVAGGMERLLHDMQTQAAAPADHSARVQLAQRLHQLKNQHYLGFLRTGAVPLRPGVRELLDDCRRAGVHLGIVTTTGGANVAELLRGNLGEQWRRGFSVVIAAEEAPRKKPDPQAYDLALEQLGLRPAQAVAIEDSPAGASAAHSAGIAVLLTRSSYFAAADVAGVMAVGPSLAHSEGWHPAPAAQGRIDLPQICQWHAHFVAHARRAPAAPPAPLP
jgi:HAD superfamily hydrolase (TIGR01509 family)